MQWNYQFRSKIDWFVGLELCNYSTGFDVKFAFGPKKFLGLSRNDPLIFE